MNKNISFNEIVTYLVDYCGLADTDFDGLTRNEVLEYVEDKEALMESIRSY